eukprot:TRINITY_DN9183_c0_g1_i1.p1 TRINITY_DN9183_c0_g1~~TRINITY_DN9183_c0_g1_i1.p1  ORF type:complete len:161 (-),score=38.56 TRINITY_DN9183_c0_g1_i1:247-729(-)
MRVRAAKEVSLARSVSGLPCVLGFLGAKQADPDTLLLCFELCSCTLRDYLSGLDTKLESSAALHLAKQAATALAALHKRNVAHLDVKSENFFVRYVDESGQAPPDILLGDFWRIDLSRIGDGRQDRAKRRNNRVSGARSAQSENLLCEICRCLVDGHVVL